jgi:hypothetical protein
VEAQGTWLETEAMSRHDTDIGTDSGMWGMSRECLVHVVSRTGGHVGARERSAHDTLMWVWTGWASGQSRMWVGRFWSLERCFVCHGGGCVINTPWNFTRLFSCPTAVKEGDCVGRGVKPPLTVL